VDFFGRALALVGVRLLGGLGLGRDAGKGGLCLGRFALGSGQTGGQLDAFGFGQLLALLGLVALGAQAISIGAQAVGRRLGLGCGGFGLGVCVGSSQKTENKAR